MLRLNVHQATTRFLHDINSIPAIDAYLCNHNSVRLFFPDSWVALRQLSREARLSVDKSWAFLR